MAQHTPGPWEFRVYADGCTIVSKHDAPGRSVRDWLKGVSIKVDAEIDDDQSNARQASPDALLIVAAPELLTAGEALVEHAKRGTGVTAAHLNCLMAAIAKAKGGPA